MLHPKINMFQFKTRGESEKVFTGLRPSYKHPRATKLKQGSTILNRLPQWLSSWNIYNEIWLNVPLFFSSKCLKESIPKIRYQQEALKYYIPTQSLNSDEQQVLLQWLYTKSQTQSDTIPTEHSKLVLVKPWDLCTDKQQDVYDSKTCTLQLKHTITLTTPNKYWWKFKLRCI